MGTPRTETTKGYIMEKTAAISVCVGNYGEYASGRLIDRWASLPMEDAELAEFIRSMQRPGHEELYISDYDGIPFGLDRVFTQYARLEELNALARLMQDASPWELEAVEGALGCGVDEPATVLELCNLIIQADEIPYTAYTYEGCDEYESLGMTIAEESGLADKLEDMGIGCYFDYEAYGRDIAIEVFAGSDGYVYDDMPDMARYDWEDVEAWAEPAERHAA